MGSNGPAWGRRALKFRAARDEAAAARREADRLSVRAWNIGLDQGVVSIQPSPSIGQAINGGFPYLRVRCQGCHQYALVDLRQVKRRPAMPVWQLEGALACTRCREANVRAPRAVIDRLTATDVASGWTEPLVPDRADP